MATPIPVTCTEVKKQIRKIYLTHDVDSPTLYRSWKGLIRSIRDRRGLYKSFQGKFGTLEKDPFYTFPWFFRQNSILQDLIGKEQCHPILFIRNGGKAKHDKPHYDLRNKDIRKLIKSALEHNVTIGLHSSYQAGTTPSLIRKEKTGLEDHIGKNVRFNRHHFLAIREPGRYGPNRGCWGYGRFHHGVCRCLLDPVRDLLPGSLDQSDHPPAISSPTTSAYYNGLYPRGGKIYGTGF